MNAYWRALRTDPRFAACLAAILLLGLDDVPQPQYSTFWDPGGALLLSLIYGNCVGLVVARNLRTITWRSAIGWLLAALPVKYLAQHALYVRNAALIDSALLLAAHAFIAVGASPDRRFRAILFRVAAGSVVLILFLFLLGLESAYAESWKLGFASEFFTYAAARAVVPYAFWTAVLASARLNPRPAAG